MKISYSSSVMSKHSKTGMMNLNYMYKVFSEHFLFVFMNASSHASLAVYVAIVQGTELDPACVRLPSPHTIFEPWQIIVLFCLRYLWLLRSFYYSSLFNLVIAYLSVSSHIVVHFVVILSYQPTPQKDSHVHRGMGKVFSFYTSITGPPVMVSYKPSP
jgi:hypothetical protein